MADSYEFLKGHYDRIQSEQRARDKECGEDHVIGERPDDCFACLSEQRDELLTALKTLYRLGPRPWIHPPSVTWEQWDAAYAAADTAIAKAEAKR